VPFPVLADGQTIFCDNPDTIADQYVETYVDSDIWQRLHALWLGLCAKVENGSIETDRAIRIFEHERARNPLSGSP